MMLKHNEFNPSVNRSKNNKWEGKSIIEVFVFDFVRDNILD